MDSIAGSRCIHCEELVSYNTKVLDDICRLRSTCSPTWCYGTLVSRGRDIEKEKGVILEELKMEVDKPGVHGP